MVWPKSWTASTPKPCSTTVSMGAALAARKDFGVSRMNNMAIAPSW